MAELSMALKLFPKTLMLKSIEEMFHTLHVFGSQGDQEKRMPSSH